MRWPWVRAERELELEVRYHMEALADAYERQGLSRAEALAAARRDLGPLESYKDQCRDQRRWHPLEELLRDVRFGWRMLMRAPTITATALLSLALGIGATAAMATLADVLLWRTLNVPQPEQLSEVLWDVRGSTDLTRRSMGGGFRDGALQVADYFSLPSVEAMSAAVRGHAAVTAQMGITKASVSYKDRLAVVRVRAVAGDFFSVLGVRPGLGRVLTANDDTEAAPRVVVLSYRFWNARLGGAPDVVGRVMRINNQSYEIAGALPKSFGGIAAGDDVDLYTTIWQSPQFLDPNSLIRDGIHDPLFWWLHPLVRRAPGTSPERLKAMLDAAFASSWDHRPAPGDATPHVRLSDASRGLGHVRRDFGKPLVVLLVLAALALLAACANIANLLLARSVSRAREVALRVSLGGGRARLIRQFLTESLLLAALGGVASVPVSMAIVALLARLVTHYGAPMVVPATPDARSLAGAALLTLMTALLFGLYPAWRAAGSDTAPALKRLSGDAATSRRLHWTPARLLVLGQVALGVVLMASAVLFAGNLWELVHRETGFERGNTILFDIRPGELGYRDENLRQFYLTLDQRLNQMPGVQYAGFSIMRPMSRSGWWSHISLGDGTKFQTAVHHVTPGFLGALRIPVVAGRMLSRQEIETGARVAVVSEDFARRMGTTHVLGERFKLSAETYEIVGVARNARYSDMKQDVAVAYMPFDFEQGAATVVLGTSAPPLALLPAVRDAVRAVNRDLPLVDVYTMEEQISRTLERERLFAWLCGGFGVLALVLCVVGLYGLLAHLTARRTHEIGVRMAMGATRGDIIWRTLRSGLGLTLGGLIVGVPPAVYALRLAAREELVAKGPFPSASLATAVFAVALAALLAALLPALRAASVDPARALRRD